MLSLAVYNQDVLPNLQAVFEGQGIGAQIDGATYGRRAFVRFRGELYGLSAQSALYRLFLPSRAGSTGGAVIKVATLSAQPNTAEEFQGQLWIGSYANGNVYSWDGAALTTDETGMGTGPLVMAAYREELLAFGTNYCKRRGIDGAWSTVSMPGGMTSFVPRCRMVYKDVLYIGGYDDGATLFPGKLLSYDGTSLAVARSVVASNSLEPYAGITDLAVFNGYLFYAYQQTGASRECKIGRFDGSSYVDDHKDVLAQIGSTSDIVIGAMAEYRRSLVVGFGVDGAAVYRSPGSSTSGEYVLLGSAAAVYDMVPSV